jgi:hypothetical protein
MMAWFEAETCSVVRGNKARLVVVVKEGFFYLFVLNKNNIKIII